MEKIRITKLEIEIGETTVSVSPEQASALYNALAEFFGKTTENFTYVPYPVPVMLRYPLWPETWITAPRSNSGTLCHDAGNTVVISGMVDSE